MRPQIQGFRKRNGADGHSPQKQCQGQRVNDPVSESISSQVQNKNPVQITMAPSHADTTGLPQSSGKNVVQFDEFLFGQ